MSWKEPLIGALAALAFAGAARGQEALSLNFANADIEAVAAAVGQMTGRNFVLDPRVKGTVNIVSAKPVSAAAAYDMFLSALRLQGFAVVESAGVTKIVPEAEAKVQLSALPPRGTSHGDRLVTQVYALKFESASQLLPVLRPIISPNNPIAVYPASNTLVITDYADNLRRIERIIEAIDRPGGAEPVVIPLRYAAAHDLAETVNRILSEGAGAAGQAGTAPDTRSRVLVAADSRTNSLIVRSDNPARIGRVQAMVQQLDIPTGASGNIHVVYLRNAEAVRVAQTLRSILAAESGTPQLASPAPTATGSTTPLLAPAPGLATQGPQAFGGIVQADPASNAVIISAPDAIFANLRRVIEKLDVRRAQVFVEALIVEVTADKAAEFGIQWQSLSNLSSTQSRIAGGTNFGAPGAGSNIVEAAGNLTRLGPGLSIGVVRGTITIPGVGTVTNLAALARALETDAKANILSTPNLLTLDNEEAKIVVGQNVPFITGQYAQTGSTTTPTPFQTIERRDVGLTLRVRPQVSEGGTVRLQIYQEVSSVQDRLNAAGIITNKRSIESTVLIDDGQIVALGGLVQDGTDTAVEKVPVLGDIPGLGLLFRYETRKQTKTNLMVFLRPIVLREGAAAAAFTSERYRQMQTEQEATRAEPHPVLPDMEPPVLPAVPEF
ncbi:MAG TPA: type II secretion system secretin GspD [Burkholderiales bacterium]|nr:type II secretion system secretin GspD [Burkholderiales bacterium]